MARRKSNNQFRLRKLDEAEMLAVFDQALVNLAELAGIYDGGHDAIAFPMATEINNLLTGNGAAARLRGTREFGSIVRDQPAMALNAHHPLIMMTTGGPPPAVRYMPQYYIPDEPPKLARFVDWWNRDVIYRPGAAMPGAAPIDAVPLDPALRVPFDARETLSRREFIKLLRDKRGAHPDEHWPELFDDIQQGMAFVATIAGPDGTELSTADGSLPVVRQPLAAMVRQIAHEVLVAYGRDDPPPPL